MLNGTLNLRFLNGFGGSVNAANTFDVLTANGGITTALGGTRVSVFGATGTFAVQLVNAGKTLRLTDYQPGAVTFSNWAHAYGLSAAPPLHQRRTPTTMASQSARVRAWSRPKAVGGPRGISSGTVEDGGQKYPDPLLHPANR